MFRSGTPPTLVSPLIHFTSLPLLAFLHNWMNLPGVSPWILLTIQFGYILQFDRNPPPPPPFQQFFLTAVNSASEASVLQQEVSSLLLKGAIEGVSSSDLHRGFYQPVFSSSKEGWGFASYTRSVQAKLLPLQRRILWIQFRILTLKSILSQVQEGDWVVTVDLKDAYFHIQVVQRHRKFLRFAFGGKAYQYKDLPFGLALALRTFTKCMDAALAPLRLQGIRILNYLDDWLILARSR